MTMSMTTQSCNSQKLADAVLSLKAVRKYQRDRRTHRTKRVRLYFDNVDGDWLEEFNEDESNVPKRLDLSQDLYKV